MSEKTDKIVATYYRRVSTKDDAQIKSFDDQKRFFEDMFEGEDSKYVLAKSGGYSDYGVSGTTLNRKSFNKMLKDAGLKIEKIENKVIVEETGKQKTYKKYVTLPSGRTPKFGEILVSNTSRFSRNIAVSDILNDLKNIDVYVTFLDVHKTTRKEEDIAFIQIMQNFDEMFSRDLSRKVRAGNKRSAERQIVRSTGGLYGYKYIKRENNKDNNRLVKIEHEARVIQTIFRSYYGCYDREDEYVDCDFKCKTCYVKTHEGYGFRVILDILNNQFKYKTRDRVLRGKTIDGKGFAQSALKNMLENEKYKGCTNNRKINHGTVFNKFSYPQVREEYDVLPSEFIDVIVPPILFDRCTEKRLSRSDIYSKRGFYKGKHTQYQGMIYCYNCENVYTHNMSKNRRGFYNCKTKKLKGSKKCKNKNVYDSQIDEHIDKLAKTELNELIDFTNINLISILVCKINSKLDTIKKTKGAEYIDKLKNDIEDNKRVVDILYVRTTEKDAILDVLKNRISIVQQDIIKDELELEKLTKDPLKIINECNVMLNSCFDILKIIQNKQDTYTHDEVLEFIDKLIIFSHENIKNIEINTVLKSTAKANTLLKLDLDETMNVTTIRQNFGGVEITAVDDTLIQLNKLKDTLETLIAQYN